MIVLLSRQADFCNIHGGHRTDVTSRSHLWRAQRRFRAEQLGKAGGGLPEKVQSTNCNHRVTTVTELPLEEKLLVFLRD